MRRLLLASVLLAVSSCATFSRPAATFALECNVPEAVVVIDDVLVGRASEWAPPGRLIRTGFHRIEVRHPGYFTHYAEIQLADGATAVVKAKLHPLLD
jgi:hypothetical protein